MISVFQTSNISKDYTVRSYLFLESLSSATDRSSPRLFQCFIFCKSSICVSDLETTTIL
jgi:hypothetical protein